MAQSQIDKGIDPAVVEAAAREQAAREAALRIRHSFAAVAEIFIADKLAQERNGRIVERDFRSTFIAAWGDRPISEITKLDVLEIINSEEAQRTGDGPLTADYGRAGSSAGASIRKSTALIGHRATGSRHRRSSARSPSRSRRLTDAELFAFWRATGRMKYPVGSTYRMLLLTGLRLNECRAAIVVRRLTATPSPFRRRG